MLVWRDPPRDNKCLGSVARNSEPLISQVFVVPAREEMESKELWRRMPVVLGSLSTLMVGQLTPWWRALRSSVGG